MKFYELTKAYLQIMDLTDHMDEQTFLDTLESIQDQFEVKAENIVKLCKLNDGEITAIEEEIKRLEHRKKMIENKNSRLVEYLYHHMKTANLNKVKSPLFTISIAKNPPKVKVLDEKKIPPFYFKQDVKEVLDKKELLKDLKTGLEIDGVVMVQDTRLDVK